MASATCLPCSSRMCIGSRALLSSSSSCDSILGQVCTRSSSRQERLARCRCTALSSHRTKHTSCSIMTGLVLQPCPLEMQQHQKWQTQQQLPAFVSASNWQNTSSSSSTASRRPILRCNSIGNGNSRANGNIMHASETALHSRQAYYHPEAQQVQQQQQQQQTQQQWEQPNYSVPRSATSQLLLQQRQAQAMRGEQQWQQQQWPAGQQDGDEGFIVPRPRFVSRSYSKYNTGNWFTARRYQNTAALHAAILERCGRGQLETAALRYLIQSAESKRDAQLALSALQAVRGVAVSRGSLAPWEDSFLKAFVKMTATCDAHEVLVSAMNRPNELGLVFKWKSLLMALKHWGDASAVDSLEAIVFALHTAGVQPNSTAAYVLVRAYVNAGKPELVDGVLSWFKERGVTRFKPAMLNLMRKAGLTVTAEDAVAAAAAEASDDEESA